jgi:hypothetical protein
MVYVTVDSLSLLSENVFCELKADISGRCGDVAVVNAPFSSFLFCCNVFELTCPIYQVARLTLEFYSAE